MQTIGVLLLAAATAGDGFGYSSPGVGLKKWLRPHAVVAGDPRRAGPSSRPQIWPAAADLAAAPRPGPPVHEHP